MRRILMLVIMAAGVFLFAGENKPFPQGVDYLGGIKPTNYSQSQMNSDVKGYFDNWKSKYVRQSNGVTPGGGYYVNMTGVGGDGNEITTSEAHGYGMLAFVFMAGYDSKAKAYFDGMYNMYNRHRSKINRELMSWVIDKSELTSKDSDSAADGDMDIAYALLLADKQWGSGGAINYLAEAKRIISKGIKISDTHQATKRTALGDWDTNIYDTRSSDWMTGHFYSYAKATGDNYWNDLRDNTYSMISQISAGYSSSTGLMPDFVVGSSPKPAAPNFLEAATDGDYSWNACRFPWRMALDYAHTGSPQAKAAVTKLTKFIIGKTGGDPSKIKAGYKLNGEPLASYSAMAFTAPFVAGAAASGVSQDFVNKGWSIMRNSYDGYYEDTINLLCMIFVSGNWWAPEMAGTAGGNTTNDDGNNIFDTKVYNDAFYINKYADLKKAFGSDYAALRNHWKSYGIKEGRQAHADFSVRTYLARYTDLQRVFGSDFEAAINHYVTTGAKEGRSGSPETDTGTNTNTITYVSAFTKIDAEKYGDQNGVIPEVCIEGGHDIGHIENGDYAMYYVDFGTEGAEEFGVRAASSTNGGNIEIRLDSISGKLIGKATLGDTGSWQTWTNIKCSITKTTGKHKVYLKFTGGSGYLMNIKEFYFIKASAPVITNNIVSGKIYKITAKHSGKVLDVTGASTEDGALIQQWTYRDTAHKKFRVESVGGGYYKLTAVHSGKVLDVKGNSVEKGGVLHQWTWRGSDNQLFKIEGIGNGYNKIINKNSGLALDVAGISSNDGAGIIQWSWNNTENQMWKFEEVSSTGTETTTDGGTTGTNTGTGTNTVTNAFYNGAKQGTALIGLKNGEIDYNGYANRGESNENNTIIDFSYSGYKMGGVRIPEAEVKITLYPQSGDNKGRIQDAINYVAGLPANKDGVRGAVLLKKGRYDVNGTIYLNKSGVVLRGEGQGSSGTVIYNTLRKQNNTVEVGGNYSFRETSLKTDISSAYNGAGTKTFTVEKPAGFRVGDDIGVVKTPNQRWLDDIGMAKYGWTTTYYKTTFERKITAIDGNKITINIPIVDVIETKYGGGYIVKAEKSVSVQNCGIERIRFDSYFSGNEDENHGWAAIQFEGVENSWVRNVTAIHYGYSCVNMTGNANFNTIQDCAMLEPISQTTGGRKYSFAIQDGTGNLFQRCYTNGGRHDYVTGSKAAGPNVFLDCYAENCKSNTGPHHRWATGILFDNIYTKDISVENREDSGSGHGWSGAQIVFWNCETQTIVCDAPVGAMNFAIGCTGVKSDGQWAPNEPAGYFESHGRHVALRSLYIQQLYDRLGKEAAANVFTTEQLTGDIYDKLKAWAGK